MGPTKRPKVMPAGQPGVKKFGNLNSFQPTLNFPPAGPSKPGLSKPGPSTPGTSKPGPSKAAVDRKRMPPPTILPSPTVEPEDRFQMWADRYAPLTEADLAPGKARVGKVREWLSLYADAAPDKVRKYKRILLLTGPAGAGKTTTVRVIAKELGVDLVEWGEGVEEWSLGSSIGRESPISKLTTFLSRHSFSSLSIGPSLPRPRALLMTSLPNLSHAGTKDAFHSAISTFCKSYSPTSAPLIIIHSDAGSNGRAEESWMERERTADVLGDAKDSPWVTEIEFIPLAPTFITKALSRILQRAIPDVSARPPASALQLIALTSHGDLRSAINSLQLLCFRDLCGKKRKRTDDPAPKKGKGSRGGKGAKVDISDDLRAVLDAVTRREQSLNLFHALGKVLYNKRLSDPNIDDEDAEVISAVRALPPDDPLPRHLSEYNRAKSLVDIDTFLPTIPIDASSFALWLHESLPSFCIDIDQAASALDDLCRADIMRTDDDIWQSSPQAIAYALHLSVRGALMALPSPVPRNHQKLIKPQFFASFRTEQDNFHHLDKAAEYICKKSAAASRTTPPGTWCGLPSNTVMATELVPMLVKIQGLTDVPLLPASVKPMATGFGTLLYQDELSASGEGEECEVGDVAVPGGWDVGEADQGEDEDEVEEIEDWD